MSTAYDYNSDDLGVLYIPPNSPTDIRVPTAEEMTLNTLLSVAQTNKEKYIWTKQPIISGELKNNLFISLEFNSEYSNKQYILDNFNLALPPILITQTNIVLDLYLVSMLVEIGAVQDEVLGQVSFQYDTPDGVVTTPSKENTRRLRERFLLLIKNATTDLSLFLSAMTIEDDGSYFFDLTGDATLPSGFVFGSGFRLWDCFGQLNSSSYRLPLKQFGFRYYPIASFNLYNQDYSANGYTYQGEDVNKFDPLTDLKHKVKSVVNNPKEIAQSILTGKPTLGNAYLRKIGNLSTGSAPGGYTHQGIAWNRMGNGQKVSFTNESRQNNYYFALSTAISSDQAIYLSVNNLTPQESYFSLEATDHKIYNQLGQEISGTGRFIGLGSNNTLIWYSGSRSNIGVGDALYFVPSLQWESGLGIPEPVEAIRNVYLNNEKIDNNNIRIGYENDLISYEDPLGVIPYFVVWGKERSAIHYILKKIAISTDSEGLLKLPSTESGIIAFIEGITGRIDKPIVRDLAPNTIYNLLIYYPPKPTELWQFEYYTLPYQGLGKNYLDQIKAKEIIIDSDPFLFVHGNGGGNGVFKGDALFRFVPCSLFLPKHPSTSSFEISGPILYEDESSTKQLSNFRELYTLTSLTTATPRKGQKISFVPHDNDNLYPFSLNGKLIDLESNIPLGFLTPEHTLDFFYQYCLFFLVKIDNLRFLFSATFITNKETEIELDTSTNTAFDFFLVNDES